MSKKRKLLVAVDFSEASNRALRWALDYAQHVPSELHIFHVVERILDLGELTRIGHQELQAELDEIRRRAEAQLESLAAPARSEVGPLHPHVASGKPDREIVRVAGDLGVDLVVMGTHGLGGVERMLIGSVAEQVVRRARCTVVTVK